ncbi:natural resistance-associated macrophage protein [Abortiporus biennis]|nr:natural resistance-associated macrophage protein [Abortiporus biennis]
MSSPPTTKETSDPEAKTPDVRIEQTKDASGVLSNIRKTFRAIVFHTVKHTGVGIVCAVAYFDPGNWGVDLQAGSQFGYKLLFIVLLSGLFAMFLQVLASRLGCVTGLDLASHCRLLLHDRPKHKLLYRWLLLYPLYILSEAAIISTDLAELLGSGIALCLLFPKLPLWGGVLLTASDVFLLLALRDPVGGKPVRLFELLIGALVLIVLICMAVIISKVGVNWGDAFDGFVPSKTLFQSGGLYTSIGIIGATVMPHSLFLGSALATQDRVKAKPDKMSRPLLASPTLSMESDASEVTQPPRSRVQIVREEIRKTFSSVFKIETAEKYAHEPKSHAERENNPLNFVRAHIYHGMVDIIISLLGFAVIINSLILILASAVFYYGASAGNGPASLFDAHDLLRDVVGKAAATLFALALLAAGQSASIIATMAGQTVSEGFLRWRVSPVMRRLITRCLGLIPSMTVAIAVGRSGVDTLLVASQVALSIVLPFIVFPLLYLTSSKSIMQVKVPSPIPNSGEQPNEPSNPDTEAQGEQTVDYSNGIVFSCIGYFIWIIMLAANVYAIVSLGLGTENA